MEQLNNTIKIKKMPFAILIIFSFVLFIIIVIAITSRSRIISNTDVLQTSNNLNIQKYTKTNSWFSSAYEFPTEPLFIHPQVLKITKNGIGFSYPKVVASVNAIIGAYTSQCTIQFDSPITNIINIDYGEWETIFTLVSANGAESKLYLSLGRPYFYVETIEDISFDCVNSDNNFIFEKDSTNNNLYRVIVMPDNASEELVEELKNAKWVPTLNTKTNYKINKNNIITNYFFNNLKTNDFIILYPHQINALSNNVEILGTYETSLGRLSLIKGNSFETKVLNPKLVFDFEKIIDKQNKEDLIINIEKDIDIWENKALPSGVYFKGTDLGAIATLVQLSQQYSTEGKEDILDKLQKELVGSLDNFRYDNELSMVIATNSEFGNKEGNDHHFHYGYYIRAAAVLVKYQPETLDNISHKINLLVKDIATTDEKNFPNLRNYSIYEGHSWASGMAPFADGNNQESISEALNAWYAIKLWGEITKDKQLENLGTWLFSQELEGAKSYWYGINNSFPEEYEHEIASLVWGGKRDYATWFSGEDMHIYGIQWLPITPASNYYFEQVVSERQIDELKEAYTDPAAHEWGDLYLAYLSTLNSSESFNKLEKIESFGGIKLKSLLLQTIYSNLEKS